MCVLGGGGVELMNVYIQDSIIIMYLLMSSCWCFSLFLYSMCKIIVYSVITVIKLIIIAISIKNCFNEIEG